MSARYQSLVSCYNQSHYTNCQFEYKCLTSIVRHVKEIVEPSDSCRSKSKDIFSVIISTILPYNFTTLGFIVNTGIIALVYRFRYECNYEMVINVKSKFVVLDTQHGTLEKIGFSTPIMIAVRNGFLDIFELLLKLGAHTQELHDEFYEPHLSYETNINSLKIYRFFFKSDIATHSRNFENVKATEQSLWLAYRIGLFDIVKLLINTCIGIYNPFNELIRNCFEALMIDEDLDMLYILIQVGIFNKWRYLNLWPRRNGGRELIYENRHEIATYLHLSGFIGKCSFRSSMDFNVLRLCSDSCLSIKNITRICLRNYFIHFTDAPHSIHMYLNELKIPPILIAFLKMEDVDKPFVYS